MLLYSVGQTADNDDDDDDDGNFHELRLFQAG
jgi:hypothetical protein